VSWFDHAGYRREKSTRTTDYRTAERIAAKLANDAALRREGIIDAAADRHAKAGRRAIAEHLDEFVAELAAKGVTAKQAGQVDSARFTALWCEPVRNTKPDGHNGR